MKKIAIVITVLLLLMGIQASAQDYQTEQTEMLIRLNILDSELPDAEDTVTRGAFANILGRFIKMPEAEVAMDNSFADVSAYTEGSAAIYYLKNLGIMLGSGDGNFYPDQPITERQAVITLARALGYGYNSEETQAAALGIGAISDRELTYAGLVSDVFNALHCDCIVVENVGANPTYTRKDNYLSEKFGIYKKHDIVQSNSQTSLDGSGTPARNTVVIGTRRLNCEEYNIDSMLGMDVIYYYALADDQKEEQLIYAYPSKSNTVTEIRARDVVSFDGKTLKYTVGSWEKTLTVKGNADVIYNDVACPNYDDGMLMPLSGKITYIENGSDYACIKVEEYTNDLVMTSDDDSVSLKSSAKIELGKFDQDKLRITDAEGKAVKAEDIPKNSVLSMYYSKDRSVLRLVYSTLVMESAAILRMDEDTVTIDGTEYYVNKFYQKWQENIQVSQTTMYKVYFDWNGEIARFEKTQGDTNFGYLIDIFPDDSGDGIVLKMMPENSEPATFLCKEKISYNGKWIQASELAGKISYNGSVAQLIRYDTDQDGVISSIQTAVNRDTYTGSVADMELSGFKIAYKLTSADVYRVDAQNFGAAVPVSDATSIFFIAENPQKANGDYYWSRGSSFLKDDSRYTNVVGYMTKAGMGDAEAVVVYDEKTKSTIGQQTRLSVITEVAQSVNADDELRTRVTLLMQSKLIAFDLSPDINAANYGVGDVVRFSVNPRTYEVDALEMVCDKTDTEADFAYGSDKNYSNATYVGGAVYRLVSGSVYSYEDGLMCLSRGDLNGINLDKPQFEYYRNIAQSPIYVIENNKVTVGTEDDIISYVNDPGEYTGAIIHSRYSAIRETILYKK